MNPIGMKLKRAGSLFLALALALTFLPASALAVNEESAEIAIGATHQTVDTNGKYLDFSNVQTIDPLHFTIVGDTSEESINLWPTSSNMTANGENDGSTVPYLVDESGETWYLSSIQWANNIPGLNPSETATGEILSSFEIYNAALDGSKDAYEFDPGVISGEPETIYAQLLLKVPSAYYICYNWTTTPPEAWGFGELPPKYTVNYDINLPSGVTQLYRIMYDEQRDEDYLEITDQGALGDVKTDVSELTRDVYEGRNFYVAAGLASRYRGFLAFSDPRGNHVSYYYLSFDDEETEEEKYPWMTGDDTITYYKSGQKVQAASGLADGNKIITLKANWVEIDPLTDKELADADGELTLDVFERGGYYKGESAAITNVVANDLLLQWTSQDENLDVYGIKTGNDVMLDEESTISYLLTTRLNSRLTSLRDDTNYGKFARFTFTLNIDNQLKFANVDADGNASIVFSSAFLKPVDTKPTNINGATVTDEGDGNYRITFDPTKVPTSTDEKSMQIEIQVEWCLDKYSYAETTKPIQISGLDFKLKEPVADKENFTLNSSANITGSMDMKTRSNIRFYYTAAYGLLNGSSAWQTHFGGNGADPVALVHALQFMDYKLADYDMSKEEDPDGPTNALTSGSCTAKASYTAYTITASAGTGGSISPAGATSVYKGNDQTFTITPNEGFEIADITVDNEKVDNVAIQENGTATYTFEDVTSNHTIAATFKSTNAVTFAPADIIVYMGGESYGGAVNEGGTIVSSSGLPEPGFSIALPDGVTVEDLTNLTFTEQGGMGRTWKLESYDRVSNEIYKLVPSNNAWPARMQFTTSDGKVIASDQFTVGLEVNTSFKMELYREGVGNISVKIGDVSYPVVSTSGTLTVRGTTEDVTITSVTDTAPASGQPGAVAPAGTTYTINGGDVLVTDTSGVSLLFDEIIDTTSENRTSQLEDRAEESLPQLSSNRDYAYQFKYLDLVDANNGNAWVKASQNMTIYWPLPEGVDTSTLRVLHFEGLHRDMTSTNVEDAISGCTVTTVPHTVSGNYVTFQIGESGFSPFALVWETTPGGGGGGGTHYSYTLRYDTNGGKAIQSESKSYSWTKPYEDLPTPVREGYTFDGWYLDSKLTDPVEDDVKVNRSTVTIYAAWSKDKTDPDNNGVSDWLNTRDHNAYLNGYGDGTFGPDNNMTRAEVAQMFYNLLLDKEVPVTTSFTDVPADAWYAKAVNSLASLGILEGVGNNLFAPDRLITRAEFTVIAMRFTEGDVTGTNIFSDVHTSDWFYDQVVGSIQYGWITGYADGTFQPNKTISRAEVTTIVNRMLGRSADQHFVDQNFDKLRAFPAGPLRHWAYYPIAEATNSHNNTTGSNGETWSLIL